METYLLAAATGQIAAILFLVVLVERHRRVTIRLREDSNKQSTELIKVLRELGVQVQASGESQRTEVHEIVVLGGRIEACVRESSELFRHAIARLEEDFRLESDKRRQAIAETVRTIRAEVLDQNKLLKQEVAKHVGLLESTLQTLADQQQQAMSDIQTTLHDDGLARKEMLVSISSSLAETFQDAVRDLVRQQQHSDEDRTKTLTNILSGIKSQFENVAVATNKLQASLEESLKF